MNDLIKLYFIVICRSVIFKTQLIIRFVLNGRCYATREQIINGTFKDYWIGWIAYKYFSKFKILNGWLSIDFPGPENDLIFMTNAHGDKMSISFNDLKEKCKY